MQATADTLEARARVMFARPEDGQRTWDSPPPPNPPLPLPAKTEEMPLPASLPVLRSRMRIAQYELIRRLGSGGMGVVYLARDLKLARKVAIKFLHREHLPQGKRFLLEARTTAQCVHENIVVIHEVSEYQGLPFMVFEYLHGQLLSELMEGPLMPVGRAVEIMVPVLRALACAHERNIVHRDLKPENIFVTDTGTIKVLDFGIAKVLGGQAPLEAREPAASPDAGIAELPTNITAQGSLVGTLPFMSPEQLGAGGIDHRSDLWAVGLILYMMVTSRHPMAPVTRERLLSTARMEEPMPSVRSAGVSIPEELADIIDRCLKKRKDERFQSAAAVLNALLRILPGKTRFYRDDNTCPYAGLNAFQEADADRFFTRTGDIAAVLTLLDYQPLCGITGPSGAGKSSSVRAGILPALKRADSSWTSLIVRPGRAPLAALAHAVMPYLRTPTTSLEEEISGEMSLERHLRKEPGYLGRVLRGYARRRQSRILVFIDQFEELYTLAAGTGDEAVFLACLSGVADDATSPLRVIISIRSDFLDRVAADRAFMAELSRGLWFLQPPDRAGLREALVLPAEMAGYRFENPAMIEDMLDALEAVPGALPLLQFTATTLWEGRDRKRRLLTEASYAELGGVAGALVGHADTVLRRLTGNSQALARRLFRRLVTPERTRDIVDLRDLEALAEDRAAVRALVDDFVAARLLVVHDGAEADNPQVELVHESLIASWPTLRQWLDEDLEMAAFLRHLRIAAKQWLAQGRSPGILWRGDAVDQARRWAGRLGGELGAEEREYLDAVLALADRAARLRRRVIAGVIAFLCALVAASVVALVTIREAEQKARSAERAAQEAAAQARAEAEDARRAAESEAKRAEEARREAERAKAEAENVAASERQARESLDRVSREQKERLRAYEERHGKILAEDNL